MAFTGTANIQQVSDSIVRVSGLSLAAGASGTIGLAVFSGTPDVRLPAGFQPTAYTYNGDSITLGDALDVTAQPNAASPAMVGPIAVVKSTAKPSSWFATLTNPTASASATLEIYIKYHE